MRANFAMPAAPFKTNEYARVLIVAAPLKHLKIVDMSTVLMGPYATQLLGDLGADVIKVEPREGDTVRGIGPARHAGMGGIFLQVNRGKRSIVLDLKQDEGRAALLKLIEDADLFVYNMRPQVMARLRLSYEDIAAVNPRVVYAGLFGYGQDGPYAARPAYDDLIQGITSLPNLYVAAGANSPRYVPLAVADRVVGLYAVGAMLAAVMHSQRTGEGQRLDVPMFETMAGFVLGDHMGGRVFEPDEGEVGYQRLLSKDRRPYPTKDGYVCAVIYNDRQWRRFFAAFGLGDIMKTDPRFASITTRTQHIDEIYAMVADLMLQRTTAECTALLDAADIPVAPLQTVDQLVDDPHLSAKGFYVDMNHPTEGRLKIPGIAAQFSATKAEIGRPAPRLGEQSREILKAAGYSDEAADKLFNAGISVEPR